MKDLKSQGSVDCNDNLIIKLFRSDATSIAPASQYDYKIVLGKGIQYKAKTKGSGDEWKWELGNGACESFVPFFDLQGTNRPDLFLKKSNNANMAMIRELPELNSDFGITHGDLRVSNSESASCVTDPLNSKVAVFFDKDDINPNILHTPNWFFYWEQILTDSDLEVPGIKLFDMTSGTYNTETTPYNLTLKYKSLPVYDSTSGTEITYGYTHTEDRWETGTWEEIPNDYTSDFKEAVVFGYESNCGQVFINSGCGHYMKEFVTGQETRGIDVFYTTFIHEKEHHLIKCRLWKDGKERALDQDNDGYPDDFEEMPEVEMFGFMLDDKTDKYDGYEPSKEGLMEASAGTWYEETKCREEQIKHVGKLDKKDWSFDKLNINQGKQWK